MSSNAGRLGVLETRGPTPVARGGARGPSNVQRWSWRVLGGLRRGVRILVADARITTVRCDFVFKKAARQRYGAISLFAKILVYPLRNGSLGGF